jgi:hypothetical protein
MQIAAGFGMGMTVGLACGFPFGAAQAIKFVTSAFSGEQWAATHKTVSMSWPQAKLFFFVFVWCRLWQVELRHPSSIS